MGFLPHCLTLLLVAASLLGPSIAESEASAAPRVAQPREAPVANTPTERSSPNIAHKRAEPDAPNGYVPGPVDCPSEPLTIRNGTGLGPQEKDWLLRRRNATIAPMRDLLGRLAIPDFDSDDFLKDVEKDKTALPNIGLAISGGGYRAMLTGGGALAAWDIRSDGNGAEGKLGGLLQSATYLSALSGGGWLVGSLYVNNFTSVQASINSATIWQFDQSIFDGPEQYSLLGYYKEIFEDVTEKGLAGFQISITDFWGRMLSYQLINATNGGPSYTFSSIADDEDFASGQTPLPFLIADSRLPGETIIALNSTVFEFTPWELGSSDPTLNGYVPLKYVGSKFLNGKLANGTDCINGFDNAGFVMGSSSSLFNQVVLYLTNPDSSYAPSDLPSFAVDGLTKVLDKLGDHNNDIADWTPNPFQGYNAASNRNSNSSRLTLVDGGEDLQNVPYHPHLLIEREVDVVFSIDASSDTDSGWPDGASAIATYQRSLESISRGTSFPPVPGQDTFRNLELNTRPVFFGCDGANLSQPTPLIVYIPNYPYLYPSNISTFQMSINSSERDAIVQNGWAVATQLNATRDPDWPACVGCAILARSFDRTNTPLPSKCDVCFNRYCWNGTTDDSEPPPYRPTLFSGEPLDVQGLGARMLGSMAWARSLAVIVALMVAL